MRALKHRMIWGLLLTCLLMACVQLWQIYQIHRENQWLIELTTGHDIGVEQLAHASPQVRLARAGYLRQKQRYNEALDTLSVIVGQGDSTLQAQSRYNLGNVYLNQAMTEVDVGRINQAMPLLTLAKQAYRQALALDSGYWDAKYNLELAMRLLPEFDRISQTEADDDAAKPSQLWTTLPGFPRGLP